jgi:hypothetical protein
MPAIRGMVKEFDSIVLRAGNRRQQRHGLVTWKNLEGLYDSMRVSEQDLVNNSQEALALLVRSKSINI